MLHYNYETTQLKNYNDLNIIKKRMKEILRS